MPGLVFCIISAILFYGFLNTSERVYYLSNYRSGIHFSSFNMKMISYFRLTDVLLIVAQVIFYSVKFIQLPISYHEKLKEEYSNIESFSIDWLKWFNASFVLVGLFCIAFYVFNPFRQENDLFLVIFLFIVSAFIWIIGLWSFKQKKASITCELSVQVDDKDIKMKDEALVQKVKDYFDQEKPFLRPDLSLTMVCREIGTNRSYLSAIINTRFGMNFNAFVNRHRVEFISDYLREHPAASKQDLAEIGGFGSVSSLKRNMCKLKIGQ